MSPKNNFFSSAQLIGPYFSEQKMLNITDKILHKINIKQTYEEGQFRIYLNDYDVTDKIRGHKVSLNVSNYAKKPEIRKFVFNQLRKSSESNSLVVDGRDIGTVVFPYADFKFFLNPREFSSR